MVRRTSSKKTPKKAAVEEEIATPAASSTPRGEHAYIVGIGASAGGLEALTALVSNLRSDSGMAYVVVQHLSPSYKSMLPQLLERETSLSVVEIVSGQVPQRDTIYITPPNRNVLLRDGRLELSESPREISPKPSVNLFFASLAEEQREDAVGVILSGTGSDGASGIRAIKASGGFTFAQDPKSARYDGMPQSAIETGCVDYVCKPDEIAGDLGRLAESRPVAPVGRTKEIDELPLSSLKRLLSKVRVRTKLDFSGYKESTLWRRVERRLFANRSATIEAYLEFVEQHPDELDRLAKDILISVTSFFRDREAFAGLEPVLARVLAAKRPGDEIRIWVPGCATGEEAYSIAIQVHRLLGDQFDQFRVQIFATDVDISAMQVARRGGYSATTIGELPSELVQRYFRPVDDHFEIVKTIRDVVIFARQDLVLDPPFLRLDLISCRNVLIYLQPALQARILSLFHYALLPEGHLFLGKSESVAQQDLLFVPENKEARIFRRRPDGKRSLSPGAASSAFSADTRGSPAPARLGISREHTIVKAVTQIFAPPSVVVNAQMQIQHVLGDASNYLQIPPGRASLDLGSLLIRELKVEAQTLLRSADQKNAAVEGRRRLPLRGRSGPMIRLSVHPLSVDGSERLFLVSFTPAELHVEADRTAQPGDATGSKELEDELIATREHLQTLVEELETSNEEMQALNEEVQAANEELQATNEELEAANEELQSTNEELLTINEELQVKSNELTKANSDLESIQDNVGMPLLVTDRHGYLTRFNAAAESLFKMHRGMIGSPLSCLVLPEGMTSVQVCVAAALSNRHPSETRLSSGNSEYLLRVTLNFAADGQPVGAIASFLDQTELLRTTRLLGESEGRLRSIMDNTPSLVATKDLAGRYVYVNRKYADSLGLDAASMVGKTDAKLLPAALSKRFRDEELIALRRRELMESQETIDTPSGQRWMLFNRFPLVDAAGEVYAICIQGTDVTDKRHSEDQLRLAARVISNAAEAVVVTDAQQRIITVNGAFTLISGYAPEEVIGQTPGILKSGRHDAAFYRGMWDQINRHGVWQGEIENRRKDGEIYAEWLTINAIRDESGVLTNYVAIFSDISSLQEARRKLEFQALHDVLTGLPNRALFNDRAEQAVARCGRASHRFAVVFIDLDNFKDINDSLGHECGDLLLKGVAEQLLKVVRDRDTVARLGGDEFVILVEELQEGEAEHLVDRCRTALAQPFLMRGNELYVSASIGIALYPDDGDEVGLLLQSADAAMYRAKQLGRNTYCFSSAESRRAPAERLNLINGLRQALEVEGELSVHFQPQFSLPDRRLIGLEALLRWRSPVLGQIPPDRFIPLAEEVGLILPLTEWLFRHTLSLVKDWRQKQLMPPPVSLNVSPIHMRTLSQSLGETLMRLLDEFGLPASAVMVEVTESAMGHSPETVAASLLQLKGLGVMSSLDDFGTGYSSLSRLSRLPISTLKIDRSFVDGLDDPANVHDLEIARTIVLMAHSLEMQALAEGVETERQLDQLVALGCDAIQGYLLGRPQPAMETEELLRRMAG